MKKYFPAWLCLLALPSLADENATRVQRGEYLVERVALCADCHSERNFFGQQDRARWLQGAKLDFKPAHLMPWAAVAPAIAGLPTLTNDDAAVRFFETGTNAAGKKSAPPMPQFRFGHDDAVAVVAYLRSLKPAGK